MPDRPDFGALFAADLATERLEFTAGGRKCFVELRPMDADAYARFVSASSRMWVDPEAAEERVQIQTDLAARELDLLLGTVTDFCLARRRRAASGEEMVEETLGRPGGALISREQRAEAFRTLTREFRQWLVGECRRVNGLSADPLASSAVGGAPGSSAS